LQWSPSQAYRYRAWREYWERTSHKEEYHEFRIQVGDGPCRCSCQRIDVFRGYAADAPHSSRARDRSSQRDDRGLREASYRETAVVLDADGATIVAVRGDGAGIHTLDSAHDKAYTSVSFKNDTIALAERAKGEDSIAPLAKLPHVMFFGGGVVIKLGDETIGAIGASGAPGAKLDDNCARAGLDKIRDRLR
jgi:uncharacterized protein GlcG (DUF336 family)